MSQVYRMRELPQVELRGKFAVSGDALQAAATLLQTYRGPDGDHEGIGFLLGFETPTRTLLTTFVAPTADHRPGYVMCSREAVLRIVDWAHARGLSLLAQVHSHPGACTWHSDGDDDMVFMPFEGMLSIVVPHYGRASLVPLSGMGVHQYQDRRWVLADPESVDQQIVIVPSAADLR